MSEWLECACYLLENILHPIRSALSIQWMSLHMRGWIIGDKIIDLQNELIGKKDVELQSVQKSVSTELRYYSSALQKDALLS